MLNYNEGWQSDLIRFHATQTVAPALNTEAIRAPTAPSTPEGQQQPSILETIVHLASDPIPNIRFNVAKALEVLATVLAQQGDGVELVKQHVIPSLEKLKDDSDADVRYFAGKALEVRSCSISDMHARQTMLITTC